MVGFIHGKAVASCSAGTIANHGCLGMRLWSTRANHCELWLPWYTSVVDEGLPQLQDPLGKGRVPLEYI